MDKFLIAGLGNIGAEYAETRHNIGFKVLDHLAKDSSTFFSTQRLGDIAEVKHKGRKIILLKPSTYMNLSGKSVNYWLQQEKVKPENLLVITDDLALPYGKIRVRTKGSAGGHNGLKSITETLASENYSRLRFGIGSEFKQGHQVDYVLGTWTEEELKTLNSKINLVSQAILTFCTSGVEVVMNSFNKR